MKLTDHFPARPDGRAMLPESETPWDRLAVEQHEEHWQEFTPENVRHVWGPRLVGLAIGLSISGTVFALAEWWT